jgi:NAD(P)H-flavin reductase
MQNPYIPHEAEIVNVVEETANIKTFTLRAKKRVKFSAGQFMMLTVPGFGEAPFTPSSSPYDEEKIEFTVMRAGTVTGRLHDMARGGIVGLRGPYGVPYPIERFYGREVFIVGGGVGLAPLRSLLLALFHEADKFKKISIKYGARTPRDIVYKDQIKEWAKMGKTELEITVDIGDASWQGKTGLITVLLNTPDVDVASSPAIVCGPPIMMKFVTKKLLDVGFSGKEIYLSMEKNMSCGVGKCFHCNIGKYFVCKDGPVLTWDMVKDIKDPF